MPHDESKEHLRGWAQAVQPSHASETPCLDFIEATRVCVRLIRSDLRSDLGLKKLSDEYKRVGKEVLGDVGLETLDHAQRVALDKALHTSAPILEALQHTGNALIVRHKSWGVGKEVGPLRVELHKVTTPPAPAR